MRSAAEQLRMGPGVWRVMECNIVHTGDPSTPSPRPGTSSAMALGAGATGILGVFWGWPSGARDPRRPPRTLTVVSLGPGRGGSAGSLQVM